MAYWIRLRRKTVDLILLSLLSLGVCAVRAQILPPIIPPPPLGVNVKWNHNPTNPPSGGYHIYYGPAPGIYTGIITVGPTNTKARVEPLAPGVDYYMVITAFNLNGLESLPTDPPVYYKAPIIPDPATNTPPSISTIPDQTLVEDHESKAITFTVSDLESMANTLTVRARSSNPRLIPDQFVLLGGIGSQRSMMIVPQLDQSGRADITLEVRDPQGASNTVTFSVTVTPLNDPPVLSVIQNQIVNEDTVLVKVPFYVFDPETSPEGILIQVFSSDEVLLPVSNILVSGTGFSRQLAFTLPKDVSGWDIIDLFATDPEGDYAWTSFAVNVLSVNDVPTLDPIPNFNVDEGSGPVMVPLTGITSGATNETQPLVVSAISSNPLIIPDPDVDYESPSDTATMVIAPLPGTNGPVVITVSVTDGQAVNGIINQSFTVTVRPFNNPPLLLSLPDEPIALRIPGTLRLDFTVQDMESPPETLRVTGQSSNRNLLNISEQDFSGTGAQRTLTLKPIAAGPVTVTVILSDGESTVSSSFQVLITSASS